MTAGGKPRLVVAKEMIALTNDLSARIREAAGTAPPEAVRVGCITCHRGVAVPKQLQDIVWQTVLQQGADAAVTTYRDLRTRYYGRQSYDFGEETLLTIGERLASTRADDAVALMRLNLEFFPQSSRSYVVLAIAQGRRGETNEAIASLKKAIELDPNDGMARGRLYQMEEDQARRQRLNAR
jgi:tetratricopeptide (TPR) repeat protein